MLSHVPILFSILSGISHSDVRKRLIKKIYKHIFVLTLIYTERVYKNHPSQKPVDYGI